MEKVSEVFFSEHGLTSTSASHLADWPQEVIAGNEAKLKNMTFFDYEIEDIHPGALIYAHVPSVDPQKVEDVFYGFDGAGGCRFYLGIRTYSERMACACSTLIRKNSRFWLMR